MFAHMSRACWYTYLQRHTHFYIWAVPTSTYNQCTYIRFTYAPCGYIRAYEPCLLIHVCTYKYVSASSYSRISSTLFLSPSRASWYINLYACMHIYICTVRISEYEPCLYFSYELCIYLPVFTNVYTYLHTSEPCLYVPNTPAHISVCHMSRAYIYVCVVYVFTNVNTYLQTSRAYMYILPPRIFACNIWAVPISPYEKCTYLQMYSQIYIRAVPMCTYYLRAYFCMPDQPDKHTYVYIYLCMYISVCQISQISTRLV